MFTLETLELVRNGKNDLRVVIEGFCNVIESKEEELFAFVSGTFERERLLREADLQLKDFSEPVSRPPLFGVPLGVKDVFRVNGFPTRCGSGLPPALFEGDEASSVTRLKEAGCIVAGKTVTAEFAGPEPGPTRNPHNLGHTPGGSSSGSAAGVAAGYFPVALGTQTLGSITRPASYCGVFGIKPSFGRVPVDGVVLFSGSADHVGVFLSDMSLARPVLGLIVNEWNAARLDCSHELVLGVPTGNYLRQASNKALRHFDSVVDKIVGSGIRVKRIPMMGNIQEVNDSHRLLIAGEVERIHRKWFKRYRDLYRPRTAEYFRKGAEISDEQLELARAKQVELREALTIRMKHEGVSALVCPSASDNAPAGLGSTGDPVMNIPWTNSGLPTVSLPVGVDELGLPHGLQVVGFFNEDEVLIQNATELYRRLEYEKE